MLYSAYQAWTDAMTPYRTMARFALSARDHLWPLGHGDMSRRVFALLDVTANEIGRAHV